MFATLLDPAILFFLLGLFAATVRSNLEMPAQISKFLSLYLLMAIGLKGGVALSESGIRTEILLGVGIALIMAFLVPAYTYPLLRLRVNGYNAAAIAATYGSVSAVTFIAAGQFLNNRGVDYGGYMAVALVLMESPAIIMAVALAAHARGRAQLEAVAAPGAKVSMKHVLHEAFTDGGHLLLLGSLLIGAVVGVKGYEVMKPFTGDIFKGLLAFFLLEMGLLVARRVREMKGLDPFFFVFSFVAPLFNAVITIALAYAAGLSEGDTLMLAVLAASASYIVVPAVVRAAIPEANPGIYFSMSLGMTFPFNIIIGIPLYHQLIVHVWR